MKLRPRRDIRASIEKTLDAAEPGFMVLGFVYLGIYSAEVLSDGNDVLDRLLEVSGLLIYLVFLTDLGLRFYVWTPRLRSLQGFLQFLKQNWLSLGAALFPVFRSLRVLRVLMVLRGISPYVARRSQKIGTVIVTSLPLVLYTSALAVFEAERSAPGSTILTFEDAFWWSLVTVTTVGYGDSFPVTSDGRGVAILLMFVGIGLFSTLTAILAAWVVEGNRNPD
jgi:voltage-gated potassium channel